MKKYSESLYEDLEKLASAKNEDDYKNTYLDFANEAIDYALIEKVVARIKDTQIEKEKWIDDLEAMKLLNISSKTTLQKYRDEGKIRFSQPQKKVILYDRDSIGKFIEKHAHNTF